MPETSKITIEELVPSGVLYDRCFDGEIVAAST